MPRREAKFIDRLLADLPKPWLAPYLNLVAGHRKLCASEMDGVAADDRSRALTADARRRWSRRQTAPPADRVVAERLWRRTLRRTLTSGGFVIGWSELLDRVALGRAWR